MTKISECYEKCMTPKGRLSYPAIFKPKAKMGDQSKMAYSCELIFPEGTDLSKLKKAAETAAKKFFGDKLPKGFKSPFKDGDETEKEAYAGCTFIRANSTTQPGVVKGTKKTPVTDPDDIYAGCYVIAQLTAAPFDMEGNKGVKFYLNHIWKIGDGEPLAGFESAESAFEDVDAEALGVTDGPDENLF